MPNFVLKAWIQAAADLYPLVKEYISPNNINGSKFPKTDFPSCTTKSS